MSVKDFDGTEAFLTFDPERIEFSVKGENMTDNDIENYEVIIKQMLSTGEFQTFS